MGTDAPIKAKEFYHQFIEPSLRGLIENPYTFEEIKTMLLKEFENYQYRSHIVIYKFHLIYAVGDLHTDMDFGVEIVPNFNQKLYRELYSWLIDLNFIRVKKN